MDANAYVRGLYVTFCNAAAGCGGERLDKSNTKWHVSQAVSGLISSTEYMAVIVNDEYSNLFGRPADPGERYWVQQMQGE